jgi:alpha-2-macroglobulin
LCNLGQTGQLIDKVAMNLRINFEKTVKNSVFFKAASTLFALALLSFSGTYRQVQAQNVNASAASLEVKVEAFTPKGTDSIIDRTSVRFSSNVAAIGETTIVPIAVVCNGAKVPLSGGRWVNEREWQARFDGTLAAQSTCEATVTLPSNLNFKARKFAFATGAVSVTGIWPSFGQQIDENQYFVINTNTPVNAAPADSLLASKAYCSSSKFGEKLALEQVPKEDALKVIKAVARELPRQIDQGRLLVVKCSRPLGEDAKVNLVWGRSIQYSTYPAFRATVQCEREQSGKPCIPVRPIAIKLSTQISAEMAKQFSLKSKSGSTIKPKIQASENQDVNVIEFPPPFEQNSQYTLSVGSGLKDIHNRSFDQRSTASLQITTSVAPPLAKFAASFGIVEKQVGALPVTIRNIAQANGLAIRSNTTLDDATVVRWLRMADYESRNETNTRQIPLLDKVKSSQSIDSTGWPKTQEIQVVGIPLTQPGLHQVEIESQALGQSILDKKSDGTDRKMYVRSYALVTGMAVHLKLSQENALVWVTSLETGKVVHGAKINVLDCTGKVVWNGVSDQQGLARIDSALPRASVASCAKFAKQVTSVFADPTVAKEKSNGRNNENDEINDDQSSDSAWFLATARKDQDFSFVASNWTEGIEPWRFNVNTSFNNSADDALIGHTIFARNLLRQGEMVQMKHLFRRAAAAGLVKPGPELSKRITKIEIVHQGSDQTFEVPINWLAHDTKSGTAISEWKIPAQAKLGLYSVRARAKLPAVARVTSSRESTDIPPENDYALDLGSFQVAEFRLPTIRGTIQTKGNDISVQMSFLNGGAAAGLATNVSALASYYTPSFSQYSDYSFEPVSRSLGLNYDPEDENTTIRRAAPARITGLKTSLDNKLLLDKKDLVLNNEGAGKVDMANFKKFAEPQTLRVEVNYPDPNGEVQTISDSSVLWPSAVLLGFKQAVGTASNKKVQQIIALSTTGKPMADVNIKVEGFSRTLTSTRTRTVGGFYSYENTVYFENLGEICAGKTNALGVMSCSIDTGKTAAIKDGSLLMLASAKDGQGQESLAGKRIYGYELDEAKATASNDAWFEQSDGDRIDLIPEKRIVNPGEKARFNVLMPFERATVLVSVEREGIVQAFVTDLERGNPVIEVPVTSQYAPNMMVSVLAIRPRLEPLSWGSFFKWGWRSPLQWWKSRQMSLSQPTALVDLAKPSFKMGLAEVQVPAAPSLKVKVTPSSAVAEPRQLMTVSIQVENSPGLAAIDMKGKRVAVAVVDEALLELKANDSWELVDALWRRRGHGVQTSTAQMQVIGKRHFGLKAQASGGGGGRSATRELLDTLVYWNPDVTLEAQGRAQFSFKMNDALSRFKVVVIADVNDDLVGTGFTSIDVRKDLQIISGLPPVVREGDQILAASTLRNTTDAAMQVQFKANATSLGLATPFSHSQTIELPAQSSRQVIWPVTYDEKAGFAFNAAQAQLQWQLSASSGTKSDQLAVTQQLKPITPNQVIQSQLVRLDGTQSSLMKDPSNALPNRSSVRIDFSDKLSGNTSGVRRYFEQYPFFCLEQRTSKAVGLRDPALWKIITETLPTYLDADGLAAYFPSEKTQGSDVLTAYVLSASHAAEWAVPEESKTKMLNALTLFAQGKLNRGLYSPRPGSDSARLMSAIEALSLYDRATPAMLTVIDAKPQAMALWPTSQVIDWVSAVARIKFDAKSQAQQQQWLEQGYGVLRNRLTLTGTDITFDNESRDDWWWMMSNADTNAARLLFNIMDSRDQSSALLAQWLQDMPRLMNGLVARQKQAHWSTTTANLWGSLALERYGKNFEREPVDGTTAIQGPSTQSTNVVWKGGQAKPVQLKLDTGTTSNFELKHTGTGRPYATVNLEASVPIKEAQDQGFKLSKKLIPVSQAQADKVTVGDVFRVELTITAAQSMTWVAVSDAIPAGASILGNLRSSDIEKQKSENAASKASGVNNWSWAWLAYEEPRFDAYRAFYEFMPAGTTTLSYTFRVSQAGTLKVSPSRAEAMYKPTISGSLPNNDWVVIAK